MSTLSHPVPDNGKAMKIAGLVAVAWLALATGCTLFQATPSTPVSYRYACESGQTIVATYPAADRAMVRYQERELDMLIAISGSGARYVGNGLEWWTRGSGPGSEGTLFHHLANGTTGEIVEICTAA